MGRILIVMGFWLQPLVSATPLCSPASPPVFIFLLSAADMLSVLSVFVFFVLRCLLFCVCTAGGPSYTTNTSVQHILHSTQ